MWISLLNAILNYRCEFPYYLLFHSYIHVYFYTVCHIHSHIYVWISILFAIFPKIYLNLFVISSHIVNVWVSSQRYVGSNSNLALGHAMFQHVSWKWVSASWQDERYLRFRNQVPTFAVRETHVSWHNGGTSGTPLNPSETIVLWEHYRLWGV